MTKFLHMTETKICEVFVWSAVKVTKLSR